MSERVHLFDNAKFILILLVVIGHFADCFTADHASMRALFLFIYSFHMPLFIFLSGLFVRHMEPSSPINTNRILSYVSLGFVIKLIPVGFALITGTPVAFSLLSDGGPAWFMFALAAYVTLAWLFRGLSKKYVLICSLVLGMVVGYDPSVGDFLYLSRIIVFFPFFWLGYCLTPGTVTKALSRKWIRPASVIVLLVAAALCALFIDDYYWFRYLFTGRNPFEAVGSDVGCMQRLIAYAISLVMSAAALALAPKREIPVITVFGSRTLQIYAWHSTVINFLLFFGVDALFQAYLGGYWFVWFTALAIPTTLLLSLEPFGKPLRPFLRLSFQRQRSK